MAAVHVSMYLPNSLSKVSQETLPFLLLLGSSFSQLQLLLHPSFLCHLESSAGWGSSGVGGGEWELCNTYSLTCVWAQGKGLQKAKNSASSSSVYRTARGRHHWCSCCWVLCWRRRLSGVTEVGSSCSNPGPCPGTTLVRGWRVWLSRTFQPLEIKHLF